LRYEPIFFKFNQFTRNTRLMKQTPFNHVYKSIETTAKRSPFAVTLKLKFFIPDVRCLEKLGIKWASIVNC